MHNFYATLRYDFHRSTRYLLYLLSTNIFRLARLVEENIGSIDEKDRSRAFQVQKRKGKNSRTCLSLDITAEITKPSFFSVEKGTTIWRQGIAFLLAARVGDAGIPINTSSSSSSSFSSFLDLPFQIFSGQKILRDSGRSFP